MLVHISMVINIRPESINIIIDILVLQQRAVNRPILITQIK